MHDEVEESLVVMLPAVSFSLLELQERNNNNGTQTTNIRNYIDNTHHKQMDYILDGMRRRLFLPSVMLFRESHSIGGVSHMGWSL